MSRHHRRNGQPRGRVWERLRRQVFARDGYRCRTCGRAGRLECDHVVGLERGGSSDMSNLQALCRSCHIAKTRGENDRRVKSPEQLAWQTLVAELT